MWNLKKVQMNLSFNKTEIVTAAENKLKATRGYRERDKLEDWDWHIPITIYTVTNKDLLHSTGNSTQYSIMAYMRKESKKEWVYV